MTIERKMKCVQRQGTCVTRLLAGIIKMVQRVDLGRGLGGIGLSIISLNWTKNQFHYLYGRQNDAFKGVISMKHSWG